MAIAVMPDDPKEPEDRLLFRFTVVAAVVIGALFVIGMLDAYVF